MRFVLAFLLPLAAVACTSPESQRTIGGGPGADKGNRGNPVVMHEGSRPYAGTPRLIPAQAPSIEPSTQARQLGIARQ
jgi:hypothetical protein